MRLADDDDEPHQHRQAAPARAGKHTQRCGAVQGQVRNQGTTDSKANRMHTRCLAPKGRTSDDLAFKPFCADTFQTKSEDDHQSVQHRWQLATWFLFCVLGERQPASCDGGVPRQVENGRENKGTRRLPNNCSPLVPESYSLRPRRTPKMANHCRRSCPKVVEHLLRDPIESQQQVYQNWPIWAKC